MIFERTCALEKGGDVTISPAFWLGMADGDRARGLATELDGAQDHIAAISSPHRPVPMDADPRSAGITLAAVSDGVSDSLGRHGNGDMLRCAMLLGLRNNFCTDERVEYSLWSCTFGGAQVMGLTRYGLDAGDRAGLELVDAETPAHAISAHPTWKLVVKGSETVAGADQCLAEPP